MLYYISIKKLLYIYIYMKNEFEIKIGISNYQIKEYKNYYVI